MRNILFKGKRKDNGEWVVGNGIDFNYRTPYILTTKKDVLGCGFKEFAVIPETVGQYTGLLDKDGKKVFEWDIVKVYDNFDCVGETLYVGKVQWDDTFLNWELKTGENIVWSLKNLPSVLYYEVIGNVFDNPELLEVK